MAGEELIAVYLGYMALMRLIFKAIVGSIMPEYNEDEQYLWGSLLSMYWFLFHYLLYIFIFSDKEVVISLILNIITELVLSI